MPAEIFAIALVAAVCLALMAGYPVALTLGGVSLAFALLVSWTPALDPSYLNAVNTLGASALAHSAAHIFWSG